MACTAAQADICLDGQLPGNAAVTSGLSLYMHCYTSEDCMAARSSCFSSNYTRWGYAEPEFYGVSSSQRPST